MYQVQANYRTYKCDNVSQAITRLAGEMYVSPADKTRLANELATQTEVAVAYGFATGYITKL